MEEDKNGYNYSRYLRYIGAPFVLVVAPICGYFIGFWLDTFFHTSPYLSYFLLSLGIISGMREFYKLVQAVGKDDEPDL